METALAADMLNHLEKAIRKMQINNSGEFEGVSPPHICRHPDGDYETWEIGKQFQEALMSVRTN